MRARVRFVVGIGIVALVASTTTAASQIAEVPVPVLPITVVDTTDDLVDPLPGDGICGTEDAGTCSLRAAIQEGNLAEAPYRVSVPPGLYSLTRWSGDDVGAYGDLDITGSVLIMGAGEGQTIVDGQGTDRVFDLRPTDGAFASLSDLTVFGGRALGDGGGVRIDGAGSGGLQNVTVEGNVATGDGGGIHIADTDEPKVLRDVTVRDNHADGSGGGVALEGAHELTRSTIVDNVAAVRGGGLYTDGHGPSADIFPRTSTVQTVTLAGNFAGQSGGGWHAHDPNDPEEDPIEITLVDNASAAFGGGFAATASEDMGSEGMFAANWTVTDNRAGLNGGAMHLGTDTTVGMRAFVVQDNSGRGDLCRRDTGASVDVESFVVDECGFVAADDTSSLTGVTDGLGPLVEDEESGRLVRIPDLDFEGIDFADVSSCDDQQQPPFTFSGSFCDAGAWEVPSTIVVTRLDDATPGSGLCSTGVGDCPLRAAVEALETIDGAGTPPPSASTVRILLPKGTYELTEGPLTWGIQFSEFWLAGVGMGGSIIDASGQDARVLELAPDDGDVRIEDLTITGGSAQPGEDDTGGAMEIRAEDADVVLRRVELVGNEAAGRGGAISFHDHEDAYLEVHDSVFRRNTARDGGAIWSDGFVRVEGTHFDGNGAASDTLPRAVAGGAIHCDVCSLTVDRSLFTDNLASSAGGALFTDGTFDKFGPIGNAQIRNSTFVGNHAGPGDPGDVSTHEEASGGAASHLGAASLVHNTYLGNTAEGAGGAIALDGSAELFANAFDGNLATTGDDHCVGPISDGADNVAVDDTTSAVCNGEITPAPFTLVSDLGLRELADNGGPVDTAMPTIDSVLLDGAPADGSCDDAETDARDVPRHVRDGSCDVGAVELPRVETHLVADRSRLRAPGKISLRELADSQGQAPVQAALDSTDSLVASPMAAIDLQASPMAAIPMAAIPMAAIWLADGLDLPKQALAQLKLVDVPVEGGWEPVLVGSELENLPLHTLSVGDVLDDPVSRARFNNLQLGQIDLAATPMAAIPMAAIAMGALPMAAIRINPENVAPEDVLADWCVLLADLGFPCDELGIDPTNPETADDWNIAALALAGIPMAAIPMAAIPMAAIDITDTAMAAIPMAAIELGATPMAAIPMAAIPIAGTPMAAIPMAAIPMAAIPMAAIPMAAIPMAAIDLTASLLGEVPISEVPEGLWPAVFNCAVVSCPTDTLADAQTAGAILPGATIGQLGSALSGIRLIDVFLAMTPEGQGQALDETGKSEDSAHKDRRLTDLAPYDDLTLGELLTWFYGHPETGEPEAITLGQLIEILVAAGFFAEGGDLADMTLEELLAGLLPFTDYPWESIDLTSFQPQLYAEDATGVTYDLTVAAIDPAKAHALDVVVDVPDGFVYDPGTTTGLPEPTVADDQLVWAAENLPSGRAIAASFRLLPPLSSSDLTLTTITARLREVGTSASEIAHVVVLESLEPNDTELSPTRAREDILFVSEISSSTDVDLFEIDVEAGDRLSIVLSNLPEDYDLVLYRPVDVPDPLRGLPSLFGFPIFDFGLDLGFPRLSPTLDGGGTGGGSTGGSFTLRSVSPEPLADQNLGSLFEGDPNGPQVQAVSARRDLEDERIDTAPLPRGGRYRIQVTGYDGANSPEPYTLRVAVRPGPELEACDPITWPFDDGSDPFGNGSGPVVPVLPALDALPAELDTLVLYNERRLLDRFGEVAVNGEGGLLETMTTFVDTADEIVGNPVVAALFPVDGDPDVASAYDDWDGDRDCHPDSANDVVREIGRLITSVREARPTLEHVVLVGADDQIPFGRVPDLTTLANEASYHPTFTGNNALVGSLARGFLLSDEPYGDHDPLGLGARDFFVTELALGRLVEDVDQIQGAFQTFLDFDGTLDAATGTSAFVSGYDFLTDGANAVSENLGESPWVPTEEGDPDPVTRSVTDLINEDWDSGDLVDGLFDEHDIASVNAHFDHHRSLPAEGNKNHDESDLFEIDALEDAGDDLVRTILFSMGCHSGLSVSDIQIGSPFDQPLDWAQQLTASGASVWAANSGYGYGDTEVVALSEELMARFTGYLDGSMSVGQALMFAKQAYASGLGLNGPYDEKVVMESTFYGLPMFTIESPRRGFSADFGNPPLGERDTTPVTFNPNLRAIDIDLRLGFDGVPTLVRNDEGIGSYFSVGDQFAQVTHFRPIQPIGNFVLPWTNEEDGSLERRVAGVFLTGMATSEILTNFDPVINRPILSDSLTELEPTVGRVVFPAMPASVTSTPTPGGWENRLNVVFGQFAGGADVGLGAKTTGTQLLFDEFTAEIFFALPDVADRLPPRIHRVAAHKDDGVIRFRVEAHDLFGIARANVLWTPTGSTGAWSELVLTPDGDAFIGSITDPDPATEGSIEFLVQVLDINGNVGTSTNKGDFHAETDAEEQFVEGPGAQPGFLFNGAPPTDDWFGTEVLVELIDFPAGTTWSIDGGDHVEPSGTTFTVDTEGHHVLSARPPLASGLDDVFVDLRIDLTDPTLHLVDPVEGTSFFQGFAAQASLVCDDDLAGIATCTTSPIDTTELGGPRTVTATAVDRAGNTTEVTVAYSVVAAPDEFFEHGDLVLPDPAVDVPIPGSGGGGSPGGGGGGGGSGGGSTGGDPTDPIEDPPLVDDPEDDPDDDDDGPGEDETDSGREPDADWPGEGVTWLYGADRYETAALLSSQRWPDGADTVYVGTGENFPDLLSVSSLTAQEPGPLLLVLPDQIPDATRQEILRLRPERIVIVGGTGVVSTAVATELESLLVGGSAAMSMRRQLALAESPPVLRLDGLDRYATAAAVATAAHPDGAGVVVLTTGEDFPDALVAGPVAAAHDAAVLLTRPDDLPAATIEALRIHGDGGIIVVGGVNAVSTEVAEQARRVAGGCDVIGPCTNVPLRRIRGQNRYATAAAAALEVAAPTETVYIAGGTAWPDGLGVAPIAQFDGAPVLLVEPGRIPQETIDALARLQPNRIAIIGGPSVVGPQTAADLRRHLRGVVNDDGPVAIRSGILADP